MSLLEQPFESWPEYAKVRGPYGLTNAVRIVMSGPLGSYLEILKSKVGWSTSTLRRPNFPLKDLMVGYYPAAGKMLVTYNKNGIHSYIEDNVDEYPSETLVAALRLVAGRWQHG